MSDSSELRRRSFLLGWFPFFRWKQVTTLGGVEFQVVKNGRRPRTYLLIHGDEETARTVLHLHIQAYQGTAFAVTGTARAVEIADLKIDPNRMFTRYGAEQSLRKLNPSATPDQIGGALDRLDRERPKLVRALVPAKENGLVVALHNNREYSVQDEIPASDDTAIRQPAFPREFFLCTDAKDFAVLKQSPFNVILQNKPNPDDGSLSRLAARQGFRYINLECGLGNLEGQLERLRWMEEHLPE